MKFPAVLGAVFISMIGTAQAASWPQSSDNPHPASGDLVLPMPCGGDMVFRAVAVPTSGGPVDDLSVALGDSGSPPGDDNDGLHGAFLAAPFAAAAGANIYWIGKYTVTQSQYAALSDHCPNDLSALPQTGVSWYDAVAFTAAYSAWLLVNAPASLPMQGNSIGFIRLPTEAEWEYAARGGMSVPTAVYNAKSWVPNQQLGDDAVAGETLVDGSPNVIGSRKANPLGLYDMLGNVDQWTLDLYHFTRLGRLSGLSGGFVIRGGDYSTPLAMLSTSMRSEVLPFDPVTGKATQLGQVGFRVMIGVSIGGNPARAAQMRQALAAADLARIDPTRQPLEALPGLEADTADPEMKAGLQAVATALTTARQDTLHQEIDSAISLTYAIYKIQLDTNTLTVMFQSPEFADMRQDQSYTMAMEKLALDDDNLKRIVDAYAVALQSIIAFAPRAEIDQTMAAERAQMESNADPRISFIDLTASFLDQMSGGAFLRSNDLLTAIKLVRAQH